MFDKQQIEDLNRPLITDSIQTRKGNGNTQLSYIAGHHAVSEANRIFGFGNWSTNIVSMHQADKTEYEKAAYKSGDKPKRMIAVAYVCQLRLTVTDGEDTATHEDVGFGNGSGAATAHGIGASIELATKEAVTDALKRCLRYYGNQFGLTLYDKEGHGAMTEEQAESIRPITDDQMKDLDEMMAVRSIDREWLMVAMRAEGFGYETLGEMTQQWFDIAHRTVFSHRLKEATAAEYKAGIAKSLALLEEVPNMKSLVIVFGEAYKKARVQGDAGMMEKLSEVYQSRKSNFEGKK